MNLHEKILAVMNDIQYLTKDDSVDFGKTHYKALSEEKVTSVMRKELEKHRIVVYPIAQSWQRDGQISHVDVVYKMVNVDDPDDCIEVVSCGDGFDTQDKGAGKAMTYAYKYMWLRTFGIPTGEDPDKISSEELDAKQEAKTALISEKEKINLITVCESKGLDPNKVFPKGLNNMTADQYVEALRRFNNMTVGKK